MLILALVLASFVKAKPWLIQIKKRSRFPGFVDCIGANVCTTWVFTIECPMYTQCSFSKITREKPFTVVDAFQEKSKREIRLKAEIFGCNIFSPQMTVNLLLFIMLYRQYQTTNVWRIIPLNIRKNLLRYVIGKGTTSSFVIRFFKTPKVNFFYPKSNLSGV